MLKGILLIIAITAPAISFGAVYQCTADGQTTFSDAPCGDNATVIDHKPAPAIGGRFDTNSDIGIYKPENRKSASANDSCPFINSTRMRRLIVQNKITRGMQPADVRRSWGSPSSIYTGRTTQWAYHYPDQAGNYVYFENGCVTNWSGYHRVR